MAGEVGKFIKGTGETVVVRARDGESSEDAIKRVAEKHGADPSAAVRKNPSRTAGPEEAADAQKSSAKEGPADEQMDPGPGKQQKGAGQADFGSASARMSEGDKAPSFLQSKTAQDFEAAIEDNRRGHAMRSLFKRDHQAETADQSRRAAKEAEKNKDPAEQPTRTVPVGGEDEAKAAKRKMRNEPVSGAKLERDVH